MNRGLVSLIVILVVAALFCWFLPSVVMPWANIPPAVRPVIQLPGEALTEPVNLPILGEVAITNTLLATWVSYVLVIIIALLARAGMKEVPSGIANAMEALVEMLYNIAEQTIGAARARQIFPIAATIFLLILVANLSKMLPGFESVGFLHETHGEAEGDGARRWGDSNIYILVPRDEASSDELEVLSAEGEDLTEGAGSEETEGEHAEEGATPAEGEGQHAGGGGYMVTPFLRGAATDINFPLGLAIVSFVTIQLFGLLGLGLGYLGKFINVGALGRGGMGYMDFGVGLLDLILEPIKIVSLTFRLLGNIFGGAVLVIVVSTLVPFLLPTALYGYELFVGVIQAYVFFMLTLVFSAMAMVGHGGEEHH